MNKMNKNSYLGHPIPNQVSNALATFSAIHWNLGGLGSKLERQGAIRPPSIPAGLPDRVIVERHSLPKPGKVEILLLFVFGGVVVEEKR